MFLTVSRQAAADPDPAISRLRQVRVGGTKMVARASVFDARPTSHVRFQACRSGRRMTGMGRIAARRFRAERWLVLAKAVV